MQSHFLKPSRPSGMLYSIELRSQFMVGKNTASDKNAQIRLTFSSL